jgi:hypothetical protein
MAMVAGVSSVFRLAATIAVPNAHRRKLWLCRRSLNTWDACMALVRDMCACDLLTQMISGMLEYRRRLTGFVQSLADASTLVARNVTGGLAVLPTLAAGLSWVPTQQQHVPPPPQALQRYMGNFGLTTLMV